ncbi:Ig-like domain-containing protein [Pseudomonas sp. COW5]|uniref:Ig-like domain-containing protein n=1 Tax=Pseudomonas sp. COW5 TaxID=2981253 RepID=UPI00224757B2|nr:Ig-like domain-containing protein [Pseudomonas sp. COW5]MCX2541915.1 Ig-like domain-containing protein [Pseudomonas sp. COW5]
MSTQNPFFSYCTTYPGGSPLNPGDTTPSTGVEFGGSGPAGAPFVITDNGSVVASGVFNPSSAFIQQLVNLAQGPHRFELRGNASLPATDVWLLTVGTAETLTIDSIKGLISGAEIPEGTTTSETLFAMSGKARKNSTIYLRIDGIRQPGLIAVDENGNWTYNTGTQAAGPRSYTIEGNYDSGPISTPRTLTIATGLAIDTTLMRLNGIMVRTSYCKYPNGVDAINNTGVREASGGTKPYSYKSSNSNIATVNAQGKVTGMANGTVTITVTDQKNEQVLYPLEVSNVYSLYVHGGVGWTYARYLSSNASTGRTGLTPQLREVIARCYSQPWIHWTTEGSAWSGPANGQTAEVWNVKTHSFSWLSQTADLTSGLSFYLSNPGTLETYETDTDFDVRAPWDESSSN